MLFENSYAFRKRVVGISLVYVAYFALSIAALVQIGLKNYVFGLVVPIVTSSLHFALALVAMVMNDRSAMNTNPAAST